MDEPNCFAQYFVNKQNVRSINNVLNLKLLRSENNELFVQEILKDENLVRDMSKELKKILYDIQLNIKSCSAQDFRNSFVMFKDAKNNLIPVNKEKVYEGCLMALSNMIPKIFFGNNHNSKIYKKCIKIIIYSMNRQYLDFGKLIQKWDFKIFPWSGCSVSAEHSFQILYTILQWILKKLLSTIIAVNFYVTTCKINNDENMLHYFLKNQWQKFYDKKISEMLLVKVLNKFDSFCLGKKLKQRYSLQEKLKLKLFKKDVPKLHLILKPNNEYRPIVRYKSETPNATDKYKIKERLYFLKKLAGKPYEKLEAQFKSLFSTWIDKQCPKLYFIKTDLSNAFGMINKTKLLKILCERHLELQKSENLMHIKKRHANNYKEILDEIRKPLLIRAGSTIYEWKEGLVQGYKYSPALSELYYSYMDETYFSRHLRPCNKLRLFIRVVDDYLYITDALDDAYLFLKALSNYRNVNYDKTVVNFMYPNIKFSREITFLGYSYCTDKMQVSRADTVYTGQMCYKIGFSAATVNLNKFLENRIGQSGIQINGHIFNFHYNNEELIWKHIFVTLCLSANKFCTILAVLCDEQDMSKYLTVYKKRVSVKLSNTIIKTLMNNAPRDFVFIFCINHFRYLSYKALLLCARKTSKCNILVPYVNDEMAKSNCLYGKWKEHSRIISKSGKSISQAVREMCRRAETRQIFRDFDVLPCSIQCYNHRKFYQ